MAASVYKWFFLSFLSLTLLSAAPGSKHPFHVSVAEINHNAAAKTLEISCKLFTDDFEKVLEQNYKTKVDLINPPDKNSMDSLVKKYLLAHFSVSVNGRPVSMNYIGYEQESEAAYGYIEVTGIPSVKQLDITDNLMYDLFTDQIGIVHVIVAGERKSNRLTYPDKSLTLRY